jgi:MarR family transcriptional regulator, 2-MHQ and catechol-resistance regulon repressor
MAPRPSPTEAVDLQHHPLLTTMGLLVEANAGLVRTLERHLESECGLSMQWFEVLLRLVRTPGHRLRMSDLAAQTTLSASGLTRAVDRLQAAGLVERQACPTDRRSSYAALTESGRSRIIASLPVHLAQLQEAFESVFSAQDLATFTDLARRLRDASNPCAAAASAPDGLEP